MHWLITAAVGAFCLSPCSAVSAGSHTDELPDVGSASFQRDFLTALQNHAERPTKLTDITSRVLDFGMAKFCRMPEATKAKMEAFETSTFSTNAAFDAAKREFRAKCNVAIFGYGDGDATKYTVVYNGPADGQTSRHAKPSEAGGLTILVLPARAPAARFPALARQAASRAGEN